MGPNVKFVSAITDAFSNKKMGVNFFRKKDQPEGGGGSGGGLVKDHTFPVFFFKPSLTQFIREKGTTFFCFSEEGCVSWKRGVACSEKVY